MVCTTAPLPTSFILGKASPGEGKGLTSSRGLLNPRVVKEQSKKGGPQPVREVLCCSPKSKRGR